MKHVHFRLLVEPFPEVLDFYRRVLGLPTFWSDEENYAEFHLEGTSFSLSSKKIVADAVHGFSQNAGTPSSEGAMLVFSVTDVDSMFQELSSRGVVFLSPPQDQSEWGVRVAHFRDPEGRLIEINSPI